MTDTLALMAAGFMHAISPINLLAMLASTIVAVSYTHLTLPTILLV